MNQQLLNKLKQRQGAEGLAPSIEIKKEEPKKEQPKKASDFNEKRKHLEAFFANKGGGSSAVQEVPIQKQQIKGNTEGFNNAKKLLEQNLGNKGGGGGGGGGSGLPPPPSLGGLPPPPPPPSLSSLPSLPPPPSLSNLPPPPSLSNLPPPPSLSNLSPPPSMPTQQKPSNPPPPSQNDHKTSRLPPPPSQQQYKRQQHRQQPSHQTPPPQQYKQPKQHYQPPQQQQQQQQQPQQHYQPPPQQPPSQQQTKQNKQEKKIKGARSPIFANGLKQNITAQFFGKDLAALVKKEFIRSVDILPIITNKVDKKIYNFNFPSIENHIRDIEPIQTLYSDDLDVVSCYLQKNMNSVKPHIEARRNVVNQLKTYNWNADPLKIKPIQDMANNLPSIKYKQPNLVQIKNCLIRCQNLIRIYAKHQNYTACAEIKKTKQQIDKLIIGYTKQPDGNDGILDEIDRKVQKIKQATM